MGEKVYPPPSEFPPGEDCPACTPALYESGKWPSVLYATFNDMSPCPFKPDPPNGHPFLLYQKVNPCIFYTFEEYGGTTYYCHLLLATGELRLINEDIPFGGLFWGAGEPCPFFFAEYILTCPGQAAESGFAVIQESPTPLTSLLCSDYGLMPWGSFDPKTGQPRRLTRSESQKVAMDHTLVRLANKTDHSRIHIYIDDEDLPE